MSFVSRKPMSRRVAGGIFFTIASIPAAAVTSAGVEDGIELTLTQSGPTAPATLQWTGGLPDFQIYRAPDPLTATDVSSLKDVVAGYSWTEIALRPAPGSALYYAVTEGDLHAGTFPELWINGEDCGTEPVIQVQQYNEDTFILRQSLCTNFEGPFIYLLFGEDKVLMQDTGATASLPLAEMVYGIIDQWLFDNGRVSIDLVVTHSHAHGDHVAGDAQFLGQPDTTVVGLSPVQVASFFGIGDWPDEIVTYDLGGGRVLDVIPIPGHEPSSIALYDRQTALLLTGDTLYAGRCYIFNFLQYLESIQRMVDFIADKPVVWVLGTHIEMTQTPYVDFPFGSTYHPDEHELQLTRDHLLELLQGVQDMADDPFIEAHRDFIIFPF